MNLHVVITGAGRGIGYRLTENFAATGDVVFAVVRDIASLNPLMALYPSQIIPVVCDLTKLLQEEDAVAKVIDQYTGHVDILINNVGLLLNQPFDSMTANDIRRVFDVNYTATALLIRSLLPLLGKTHAHVVNIVSMGGFQGSVKFSGLSHYSASKAALAVLTECLAAECPDIRINALALGAVQTEMLQEAFPGYQAPIDASQAATFIADFARNGHHYFNGKILPVSLSTP